MLIYSIIHYIFKLEITSKTGDIYVTKTGDIDVSKKPLKALISLSFRNCNTIYNNIK